MICEAVKDARGSVVGYPFQPDMRAVEAALPGTFSKHGPRFEEILAQNANFDNEPGVVASGLTVADVLLGELAEEMREMVPTILRPYPKLAAVHSRILALPGIKKYLASDKRFPFPKVGTDIAPKYVANVNKVLRVRLYSCHF